MLQILCVHSCFQSYVAMSVECAHMHKFTGIFCNAPSLRSLPQHICKLTTLSCASQGIKVLTLQHTPTRSTPLALLPYNHSGGIPLGIVVDTTKANNVNVHIVAANLPITHAFIATRYLFVFGDGGVTVAQLSVGTPVSSVEQFDQVLHERCGVLPK